MCVSKCKCWSEKICLFRIRVRIGFGIISATVRVGVRDKVRNRSKKIYAYIYVERMKKKQGDDHKLRGISKKMT
jgi:hypothetical protein